MSGRAISTALKAHLAGPATTVCHLLKIVPLPAGVAPFGITSERLDVTYDDGTGSLTYYAATGFTPFDIDAKPDLSIDTNQAASLLSTYPLEGVTAEGIAAGNYDSAKFVQYLVNYEDLTMGHAELNSGVVGQVLMTDGLGCQIELRSLTQVLKQNNVIELTSITCRAQFGDSRCKKTLRWYGSSVSAVGAEADRTFTFATIPGTTGTPGSSTGPVTAVPFFTGDGTTAVAQLLDTAGDVVTTGFTVSSIYRGSTLLVSGTDYTVGGTGLVTWRVAGTPTPPASGSVATWNGTLVARPDGFFVPGVVHWLTGANAGRENEVESYTAATGALTLAIPTYQDIAVTDTFNIRQDCDKSKAMCIAYGNLPNMRAEPELPRGNGLDLQAPSSIG